MTLTATWQINDYKYIVYHNETAHTNTTPSNMKKTLDAFYTGKLNSYAKYLQDTMFCQDRSIYSGTGYGTSDTVYSGQRRFDNRTFTDITPNPTLKCPNKNDAYTVSDTVHGNGKLTYPIGLLTADEVSLAGGLYFETNEKFYLRKGQAYWLMTAFDYTSAGARNFGVNMYGAIARGVTNQTSYGGVVPVVNIKPEYALKMSGNGSKTNPYVIS